MTIREDFPVALTFDLDWAPDFAIQKCVDILKYYNVPGTFFITHQSKVMEDIFDDPLFDFGIHPNFFTGSSHGKNNKEVLDNVMGYCPQASSMRTHGLFQSTALYTNILDNYKNIKYDFSLLTPNNPFLYPFLFRNKHGESLVRVPYQWEDDIFFMEEEKNKETIILNKANYQMFDFHPIHIYLNSQNSQNYDMLKNDIRGNFSHVSESVVSKYVNKGEEGALDWLVHILENIPRKRFVFAIDIARLFDKRDFS